MVACAIAMSRREQFEARKLFRAGPNTDVRGVWVEGKLATFAPAGFAPVGHGGAPLPTFLLDRGGAAARNVPSYVARNVPSYLDLDALRARYAGGPAAGAGG